MAVLETGQTVSIYKDIPMQLQHEGKAVLVERLGAIPYKGGIHFEKWMVHFHMAEENGLPVYPVERSIAVRHDSYGMDLLAVPECMLEPVDGEPDVVTGSGTDRWEYVQFSFDRAIRGYLHKNCDAYTDPDGYCIMCGRRGPLATGYKEA